MADQRDPQKFENVEEQDDGPLMLTCWNCDNEHESGALGYVVDRRQDLFSEACPRCGFHYRTPPISDDRFEEIAWTPADHPSHTLPNLEVNRRLPAINLINDSDIAAEVTRLTAEAPAYFWRVPAASPQSDYHHPICREDHGLWAHTLMLMAPLCRYAESLLAQDRLSLEERDYALAAAILHDQRKRGPHGSTNGSAVKDHDLRMAHVIRKESDLPYAVAKAVASHMGPEEWGYEGPEPESDLQDLVHTADMLASTSNLDAHVPGPVPTELQELGLEAGEY